MSFPEDAWYNHKTSALLFYATPPPFLSLWLVCFQGCGQIERQTSRLSLRPAFPCWQRGTRRQRVKVNRQKEGEQQQLVHRKRRDTLDSSARSFSSPVVLHSINPFTFRTAAHLSRLWAVLRNFIVWNSFVSIRSDTHLVGGDLFFRSQWTASKKAAFQNLSVCLTDKRRCQMFTTSQVKQTIHGSAISFGKTQRHLVTMLWFIRRFVAWILH